MIKYLQEKKDDELTFQIRNMTMADLFDDAALMVHAYTKSHMRGILTMDKGEIQTISKNQKLNTKRYWTRNLLKQKIYNCDPTLNQGHTSAILL